MAIFSISTKGIPSVLNNRLAALLSLSRMTNAMSTALLSVVFLTRKWKKPLPTHVQIMSTGMRSTALCEQITAVDVERIGDFKGHLTDEEMAQVDHALLVSVGLDQLPINRENELTMDAALAILALRYVQDYLTKPHEEAFQHG